MIENENFNPMEKEKLGIIKEHDKLIKQLVDLIRLANQTQEIIKNNGLSENTKKDCLKLFDKIEDSRIIQFKDMIDKYFIQTLKTDSNTDKILCSSDILESSFGKYKTYISKNKVSLRSQTPCAKLSKAVLLPGQKFVQLISWVIRKDCQDIFQPFKRLNIVDFACGHE